MNSSRRFTASTTAHTLSSAEAWEHPFLAMMSYAAKHKPTEHKLKFTQRGRLIMEK